MQIKVKDGSTTLADSETFGISGGTYQTVTTDLVVAQNTLNYSSATIELILEGDSKRGGYYGPETNAVNLTMTYGVSTGQDGDLFINAGTDGAVGGNLNITATTGNITDSSPLTVAGTSSFTTSANNADIVLDQASNAFTGAVSLNTTGSSGNATLVAAAGLNLAASTIGGTLSATAKSGHIRDSGNLVVGGAATFITGANGSNIILNSSGNAFSNAVTLQADAGNETFGNVTFVDSGAVRLHSSASADGDLYINASTDAAVGGNLNVTATTGNIRQGRAVAVGGTSSFTVTPVARTSTRLWGMTVLGLRFH